MPLSEPVARELRHTRDIRVQGFHRSDGLFDIEAHLVDRRAQAFPTLDRGVIPADGLLHEMWVRMTVDRDMRITDCAAVTDNAPFAICPGGAASFARLAGLTVKPGFLKAANERVGGTAGCTHIRELLQQMATVAFQTVWSVHEVLHCGSRIWLRSLYSTRFRVQAQARVQARAPAPVVEYRTRFPLPAMARAWDTGLGSCYRARRWRSRQSWTQPSWPYGVAS